jgi:hypothetical protein
MKPNKLEQAAVSYSGIHRLLAFIHSLVPCRDRQWMMTSGG